MPSAQYYRESQKSFAVFIALPPSPLDESGHRIRISSYCTSGNQMVMASDGIIQVPANSSGSKLAELK